MTTEQLKEAMKLVSRNYPVKRVCLLAPEQMKPTKEIVTLI